MPILPELSRSENPLASWPWIVLPSIFHIQHFRKIDSHRYRAEDLPKKWQDRDWVRRAEKKELRTNHMKVSSWHRRSSVKPFPKKIPAQWPMRQGAASIHSSAFQRMEVQTSWTAGIPQSSKAAGERWVGRGQWEGTEWVRLHPSITTLSTPSSHKKYLLEHPWFSHFKIPMMSCQKHPLWGSISQVIKRFQKARDFTQPDYMALISLECFFWLIERTSVSSSCLDSGFPRQAYVTLLRPLSLNWASGETGHPVRYRYKLEPEEKPLEPAESIPNRSHWWANHTPKVLPLPHPVCMCADVMSMEGRGQPQSLFLRCHLPCLGGYSLSLAWSLLVMLD